MSVRPVHLLGDSLLRRASAVVSDFGEPLDDLLRDLRDTLRHLRAEKGLGRAIAAPQIGRLQRVVFVDLPGRSFSMVNPEITQRSEETFRVWDSCFCFDLAFFVQVERYREVEVGYQDESGVQRSELFRDDLSELVQHEIDHLHGILATDRMPDRGNILMRTEWEKMT